MKITIILLFFCLKSLGLNAQQLQTNTVVNLSNSIIETSGLINLNGKLITHNDSGTAAELYEIDTLTGDVSRTVVVEDIINTDWEDICVDDSYIYIGDFGNNVGVRTDLKILKISISDYLSTPNDTVLATTINFNFANQTTFVPSLYSTNFDVEALLAYNDSLYVFTKNWGDSKTNYYAISKNVGNYSVNPKGTINSQGMVTGAVYNELSNEILLCGYTIFSSFLVRLSDFITDDFENGTIERFNLNLGNGASIQIEGICEFNAQGYYLSSELYNGNVSQLIRVNKTNTLSVESNNLSFNIFPNPVSSFLTIDSNSDLIIEIYTLSNQLVIQTESKLIDVSKLPKGMYILKITDVLINQQAISKICVD